MWPVPSLLPMTGSLLSNNPLNEPGLHHVDWISSNCRRMEALMAMKWMPRSSPSSWRSLGIYVAPRPLVGTSPSRTTRRGAGCGAGWL